MSAPPVILRTTPRAPSILDSSSGEVIAWMAASRARDLPEPSPIPISAEPASAITVRTSAKSTLISPGMVIISEIPCTPERNTSSAIRNASWTGVCSLIAWSSLSLGIIIKVSTWLCNPLIPSSAWFVRRRPSKVKGRVTTPTVKAPISLATSATMRAAPVPVPPPIPAVINTRSAPSSAIAISSRDSSAAFWPMAGLPPAPSPRVSFWPSWIRRVASECDRACASVFIVQNSMPSISLAIIRLTALLPPPPTPITLMRAALLKVISSDIRSSLGML